MFDVLDDGEVMLSVGLKFINLGSIGFGVCCSVLMFWMESVNGVVVVCWFLTYGFIIRFEMLLLFDVIIKPLFNDELSL